MLIESAQVTAVTPLQLSQHDVLTVEELPSSPLPLSRSLPSFNGGSPQASPAPGRQNVRPPLPDRAEEEGDALGEDDEPAPEQSFQEAPEPQFSLEPSVLDDGLEYALMACLTTPAKFFRQALHRSLQDETAIYWAVSRQAGR